MTTPNLNAFDKWLWSLDGEALGNLRVDKLHLAARDAGVAFPQLTVLTVIADERDPATLIADRGRGVLEHRGSPHVALLWGRMGQRDYVVAVWPTSSAGVFHLIGSVPVTDDAWARVEGAWINASAPHVSPVILNRPDFEAIGDALAEHGTVEVARMTARVLRDHSSYTRGWPNLPGLQRPNHASALSETERMLVRTLTLDVARQTRVHLRRTSGASYYRGDYGLFANIVLRRLTNAARERLALLSDRDRRPLEPVAETISMSLDRVDLADPFVRDLVLDTLTGLRGMQVAVLHDNPYLHVLVNDFLSGTSFDVLVTNSGRLDLVPGLSTRVGTLARVTDALGDALGMRDLELREIHGPIPDAEFLGA
jgi:hypothetical protein